MVETNSTIQKTTCKGGTYISKTPRLIPKEELHRRYAGEIFAFDYDGYNSLVTVAAKVEKSRRFDEACRMGKHKFGCFLVKQRITS